MVRIVSEYLSKYDVSNGQLCSEIICPNEMRTVHIQIKLCTLLSTVMVCAGSVLKLVMSKIVF